MTTLYRTDESIIGTFPVDSVKKAVELAVKQGISLANANLAFKDLTCASLKGANLEGTDFTGAKLVWVQLEGANCKGAIFEGANCKGAIFEGANFESANLSYANLTRANFESANLSSVNLIGADLRGVNLKSTNLDYAAISIQSTSTEAIVDDRFVAQLAHLLTRQDYSNCSEEVKRDIDIIKSLSITNLLAKYRNDIKLI